MSISVISHGHSVQVLELLHLLAASEDLSWCQRVWVTVNVPEPALLDALKPVKADGVCRIGMLEIFVIVNQRPLGFGANNNQAFLRDSLLENPSKYFAVLNPDIAWDENPWPALLQHARRSRVGCVYPVQVNGEGLRQDYRRQLPTPWALWRRHFLQNLTECESHSPDWVSGAFLLFPAKVFAEIQGFDERYRMYCEDVDICLRLQLAGYNLVEAPNARVTHVAQRASRGNFRHLIWHIRSLLRLWISPPCLRFWCQRHSFRARTLGGQ